jgi:hypothetical protein
MLRKRTKRDDENESGAGINCLSVVANKSGCCLGQANSDASYEYRIVSGVVGDLGDVGVIR